MFQGLEKQDWRLEEGRELEVVALERTLRCQISELMPFQYDNEISEGRMIPFCS